MNLTHFDPFREIEQMLDRYSRGRPRMIGLEPGRADKITAADWHPLADVSEDASGYHIHAELPGVKKEDVELTVENGIIAIQGKRESKTEEGGKEKKYHRIERVYGSFSRSFKLPEDANVEAVSASYKDGVLEILIPKSEGRRSKSIQISSGG